MGSRLSKLSILIATSTAALTLASGSASAAKLSQIFSPEMVGADVAYFERLSGPARNTYGNEKIYKVGDCEVTAKIAGGSIRSLHLATSPKCTFNLNKFLPNYQGEFPTAKSLTFGKFDAISGGNGRFYASCLRSCGNAADPVIYEHWHGSSADLVLEVMLEAVQTGPALSAADAWQAAMEEAESEDWVIAAAFNCTRKYDPIAHQAFKKVEISGIAIGYDLQPPQCER